MTGPLLASCWLEWLDRNQSLSARAEKGAASKAAPSSARRVVQKDAAENRTDLFIEEKSISGLISCALYPKIPKNLGESPNDPESRARTPAGKHPG
jgi:hypothetical protein